MKLQLYVGPNVHLRAVERSENPGVPVLFGRHNLPPLVKIGLTDQKSTFCLFKTEFKAKKLFARNLGMQFRRAVHIWGAL